jgi:hypothetical protein
MDGVCVYSVQDQYLYCGIVALCYDWRHVCVQCTVYRTRTKIRAVALCWCVPLAGCLQVTGPFFCCPLLLRT